MTLPGTPASTSTRYVPVANRHWWFVASIATQATPTWSELDAGTLLDGEMVQEGVSGFTTKADTVEVADASSFYTPVVPGAVKSDDSSLSFYLDSGDSDLRSTFSRGTTGFIVRADGAAPTKCDVFPVSVTAASKSTGGLDAATLDVSFAITAEPSMDVTFPSET